jgi:hypothetical protein
VTINPIDGVGQKSSAFWDHMHRKYCVLLKEDNPSEVLQIEQWQWQRCGATIFMWAIVGDKFIPCFISNKGSEWQMEVQLDKCCTCLTTFLTTI